MLPRELTQDINTRLATIKGQVDGLLKMLGKKEDMEKIITQFKAIDSGIDVAYNLLLDEVFRKALALKIVEVSDACPGDCGNEEKIEFIRKQFPVLKLDEIIKKYREITKIGEEVVEHKKKNL